MSTATEPTISTCPFWCEVDHRAMPDVPHYRTLAGEPDPCTPLRHPRPADESDSAPAIDLRLDPNNEDAVVLTWWVEHLDDRLQYPITLRPDPELLQALGSSLTRAAEELRVLGGAR